MKYKWLTPETNINNIKGLSFYILLFTFVFVPSIQGATYNYYFSNFGGGTTCSIESPCASLAVAQTKIKNISYADTVNLYFNRGDTWSVDSAAVNTINPKMLNVGSSSPIVNINAYGEGNRPIFDGLVSDFRSVPVENLSTGPLSYGALFMFNRHDCSVSNVEIKRVYGVPIITKDADGFVLSDSSIHHFGAWGLGSNANFSPKYMTAQRNIFYKGQELYHYNKRNTWEGAIKFETQNHRPIGNTVKYNVVYDIYGEGINNPNGITEYNIVGNCGSNPIQLASHKWDAGTTIARYNFIIMADWSTHDYDSHRGGDRAGIRVFDEEPNGTNANGDYSIYGNIVINYAYGFSIYANDQSDDAFGSVKVYNNTFIDNHNANIAIQDLKGTPRNVSRVCSDLRIYNNTSIIYDQTGAAHTYDNIDTAQFGSAIIDNNAYWTTGGSPEVDSNWQMNYVTGDPKLYGEEKGSPVAWTRQSGVTYYKDITFADVTPNSDSALIATGKTLGADFNKIFLTYGTDFSTLPDIPTFQIASQSGLPKWSIGAIFVGENPISVISAPQGLQIMSIQ